ncbi:MAG: hypothetical protein HHAS10_02610 [Candidatus Altimarinota bacterium]
MGVLNIRLFEEYKSFPSGFEISLEGNLIIISGVNGSGKSQLMQIIKGQYPEDPNKNIATSIDIDGIPINYKNIQFRTLQSNIQQINNIGNAEPQNFINHKNSVWSHYTNGVLLNENHQILKSFQKSSKKAKEILTQKFGESRFMGGLLQREEIIGAIDDEFIWESDDIFSNIVADSFLIYANKFTKLKLEKYDQGVLISDSDLQNELGFPPWKKLNELFKLLKIDYRFKDNYTSITGIIEQPRIYPIINGTIDEKKGMEVTDLSDGEKVITSLIFSTLNSRDKNNIKLLLLDEFDATFNPSLTEMFYKVLNQYFVDNGIMVIVVTHSPTTISLAPEGTNYYEVFRKGYEPRILPVQKTQYKELGIANKEFFDKIGNQEIRIRELTQENNKTLEILSNKEKPLLFVEGFTDKEILEKSWSKLYPGVKMPFYIPKPTKGQNAKDVKYSLEKANCFQNSCVIGLFDFDEEGYNQWNGLDFITHDTNPETCLSNKAKDAGFYALLLPINKSQKINRQLFDMTSGQHFGSKTIFPIELMFYGINDDFDNLHYNKVCSPGGEIITFKGDKTHFSRIIIDTLGIEYFKNFSPLFDKIKLICNPPEKSKS